MIVNGQSGGLTPHQVVEQEFACDHAKTKVVRFTQRNGVIIVRRQCQRCGAQVGGNLPKAEYNPDKLPEWDDSIKNRWWEARGQRSQELYEQERKVENADWFRRYNVYLNSEHWQQLRRRVIARDNFRCQNCFCRVTDDSAQVHHISYDGYKRLGQSFAFECITLCYSCHRRFHAETGNGR